MHNYCMHQTGKRIRGVLAALTAILMAVVVQALDPVSADGLAVTILGDLGRTKGVCAVANCGDGQLALSFLRRSGMKVHAMDPDTGRVRAASRLAEVAGFVAPRFYADRQTLLHMPYADRFVDCIVITNLRDADLASVSYAEIQRTLCSDGKAWVGRATSEGAGLTQAALQSWINAASKTRSTATTMTMNGTWAVITGTELSGVDVWTLF